MPERQPWITLDQRDPKDNFPILPTSIKPFLHSKERSPEVRAQHRDNLHQHFNSERCRKQDKRPERWLERGRSSPHKFHLLVIILSLLSGPWKPHRHCSVPAFILFENWKLLTCVFAAKALKPNKSFQLCSVLVDIQCTLEETNKPPEWNSHPENRQLERITWGGTIIFTWIRFYWSVGYFEHNCSSLGGNAGCRTFKY